MNNYIVLKLITGEQIISRLINESVAGIVVLDPILVRMVSESRNGVYSEQAVTSLYCQFVDDHSFVFKHTDIVFYKDLSIRMIPFYNRVCEALKKSNIVSDEEPEEQNIVISSNYH